MYHECNLVHGDLSEYNILWHDGRPVIIDVSQSVEHAHPFATEFLRKVNAAPRLLSSPSLPHPSYATKVNAAPRLLSPLSPSP